MIGVHVHDYSISAAVPDNKGQAILTLVTLWICVGRKHLC
jgi:hypothetical protein